MNPRATQPALQLDTVAFEGHALACFLQLVKERILVLVALHQLGVARRQPGFELQGLQQGKLADAAQLTKLLEDAITIRITSQDGPPRCARGGQHVGATPRS